MKVVETDLPGCLVIEPKVYGDERGIFYETWNKDAFAGLGLNLEFKQANVSTSTHGVLRGLHYQWPKPQGKLVNVLEGEVYDVAVDIRQNSPTFKRWAAVILSGENKRQFWIPPGFAHGFLVLSDSADFLYKATDYYAPQHERCIAWNDATIGIDWPLTGPPKVSAKDAAGLSLLQAFPEISPGA